MTALLLLLACSEDTRRSNEPAPMNANGPERPGIPVVVEEDDAYSVAEGKRLFRWYNCNGCHGLGGGGGMGPALLDSEWRYGSDPTSIHDSIVYGRPNGMPAFRDRLPDAQAWQIAAYVRSLSGLIFPGNATGRYDELHHRKPEARTLQPFEPWRKSP
jgi:cytochrome c oxidase cbb3-type subunit 3